MQKYIILVLAGAWFIYALINKPKWIATLFFTIVIADINFDVPGAPLNFRAIISLIVFAQVLLDSKKVPGPSFLSTAYSRYIIAFVVYVLFITYSNGLLTTEVVKEYIFALLTTYIAYYYFMKDGGYDLFKISIIISGFVCLGDLVWTYMQGGGLWIQRLYFSFTPAFEIFNHNFFGYICAIAFVFLLADYLAGEQGANKINLYTMPFMFLGVLLSTSRSSLLILIIVSVVLIAKGLLSKQNSSKAYKLVVVSLSCIVLSLFLFQILSSVFHIDSEFMEQIVGRMIDEPVAIFNRAIGNDFKAESLDSMDWRAEASEIAYNAFMHVLTTGEQAFGIGHDGFMARSLGYMGVYAAHNGVLLMLIEFGVLGFLIFHMMLITMLSKTLKAKYFSPLAVSIIYIWLYMTSHNREMTSLFALLVTGTMAGEVEYLTRGWKKIEPEPELDPDQDPAIAPAAADT